jgi:hypothetical protein
MNHLAIDDLSRPVNSLVTHHNQDRIRGPVAAKHQRIGIQDVRLCVNLRARDLLYSGSELRIVPADHRDPVPGKYGIDIDGNRG